LRKTVRGVPVWLIVVALAFVVCSALAVYIFSTVKFPVEVKEPLSVVAYPDLLSLYPNTTESFNVTVNNVAAVNYLVFLAFSLNDTPYQQAYITFSNETYTVVPGLNTLTAWISVAPDAPPAQLELTVELSRVSGTSLSSFHLEWFFRPDTFSNETLKQILDLSFEAVDGENLSITANFLTTKNGEIQPPVWPMGWCLLFDYDGDGTLMEEGDLVYLFYSNNKTSPAEIVNGSIAVALTIKISPFHVCYQDGNYLVYKINFLLSDIALKNDLVHIVFIRAFSATLHFDPEGRLV